MITGALILLAGIAIGWLLRSLPGRKAPKPVEAVCGCGHHHSMHNPETGTCNDTAQVRWYRYNGKPGGYEDKRCPCRRYSGPEPLPSYFAPEIATEPGR